MRRAIFFAVGDDLHFAAGSGEKLIGFRSSFSGTWLGSTGARGVGVGRDGLEHSVDEFGLFARSFRGGMDGGGPMAQGVEGTFEAEAFQRHLIEMRGLLHEGAHEIIGDQVDLEFLLDHAGALAAQDVQAEGGFDLGEVEFDVPALGVKLAQVIGRVEPGVRQRGGQQDRAGAEPRSLDDDADQPHGQLAR